MVKIAKGPAKNVVVKIIPDHLINIVDAYRLQGALRVADGEVTINQNLKGGVL